MEQHKNKKVHERALTYVDYRDARIAANKEESDAHTELLIAMTEEGLDVYEFDGVRVELNASRKCKVKVEKAKKTESNGEKQDGDGAKEE